MRDNSKGETAGRGPRPRRHAAAIAMAAAALGTALLLAAAPGTGSGLRALGDGLGLSHLGERPSTYRYHFSRPPQGAITNLLRDEIAFYQSRITRTPQSGLDRAGLAEAYLKMARVSGALGWYLLAEDTARESLTNLPVSNAAAALVLARVAEARHDFATAIRLARDAGPTADSLPIVVTSNLARGDVPVAARAVADLVAADPSLRSYTLRALVEVARGLDEEAEADFHRALAMEEPEEVASSTWVRSLYGRFLYQRGRLDRAGELFNEALRILPQYPYALTGLAVLELRQGHYAAAIDHLTRVVTVSRASPNVYDHVVLRGLAQAKELEGRPTEAAPFWADAEARLRQDVASGAYGHRRELARLLLTRGRPEDLPEVLSLLRAELTVRTDPDTLDTLAWGLSRAGRWQEADRAAHQALRWGVRDARYFYRAATTAQALGNVAQARAYLRLMRAADPTFDERALEVAGIGL
jgi:tetratricopeptide (TPR) repeat protein